MINKTFRKSGIFIFFAIWLLFGHSSALETPELGVFPFMVVSPNRNLLQEIDLNKGTAELLVERLNEEGRVQAKLLKWPEKGEFSFSQRVSFNSLSAEARNSNVQGFIVGAITTFNMETEERKSKLIDTVMDKIKERLPVEGEVKIKSAEANVRLEGALIDTISQEVLVQLKAESQKKARKYSGLDLKGLGNVSFKTSEFGDSLVGKATKDVLKKISNQVGNVTAEISHGRVTPEPRDNAPQGLALTKSQYVNHIERAANQWIEVEVYNTGTSSDKFHLTAESPPDLPIGFLGSGSIDSPCELPAGEWKKVRLVVMAAKASKSDYEIPVHLYTIADDKTSNSERKQYHDQASVVLKVASPKLQLNIEMIKDNPATLGQTYRITNHGDILGDFSIHIPSEFKDKINIEPSINLLPLLPGGSVEVTFAPRLSLEFTKLEAKAMLTAAFHYQTLPLIFEVPKGKKVFLVKGLSRKSYVADTEYCTNIGDEDVPIEGPIITEPEEPEKKKYPICDQIPLLEQYIEQAKKLRDLYNELKNEAKNAAELDKMVQERLQEWSKEKYKGSKTYEPGETIKAGHYRPCTDPMKINLIDFCSHSFPFPLCVVLNDAARAHEEQHRTDALADSFKRRLYCDRLDAKESAQIAGEWEVNAYNAEIQKLREALEAAQRDCNGGGSSQGFLNLPQNRQNGFIFPRELFPAAFRHKEDSSCLIQIIHQKDVKVPLAKEAGYYIAATFSLPYGRDIYTPHDTRILLNGHLIEEISNAIPEGTYVWPIDRRILNQDGKNTISTKIEGINEADYILANKFSLIAPVTQMDPIFVVASSQEEADRLSVDLPYINHNRPDLVILANSIHDLPRDPEPGQKIRFNATIMNIGVESAPLSSLHVLTSDPTQKKPEELNLNEGIALVFKQKISKRFHVTELIEPISIPALQPSERVELPIEVIYQTGKVTRLYLVSDIERGDFDPSNNIMTLTLVSQDFVSPLAGIDWPQMMHVPILMRIIDLPKTPTVNSMVAAQLSSLIDKFPYLMDLKEFRDLIF
ncbi:hypothetical protein AMJ44_09185 [candidate division WOR-1 bacterium DG_54_3]|uniref:Uncharacterized protein n=1 Tax=candidate division WOR-1 bacterium DG_54_3 TaxID=1703775 RepID=A0A0S7XU45_UNCSA|nr:MAG: hypothetical protein AMJ44_09185 [candidate division WOR-1 bacterium DG_54_3]